MPSLLFFRKISVTEANSIKVARLGVMVSVALFSHAPLKYKFLQHSMAIYLWRQGATHDVYEVLSMLGLTQSSVSARSGVDRLIMEHDQTVKDWQKNVEVIYHSFVLKSTCDIQVHSLQTKESGCKFFSCVHSQSRLRSVYSLAYIS